MKSKLINAKAVEWMLRIAASMTFLGHVASAIQGNPSWIKYIKFVGFSIENAQKLIIIIGVLDVLVAITILLSPISILSFGLFMGIFYRFNKSLIGGVYLAIC